MLGRHRLPTCTWHLVGLANCFYESSMEMKAAVRPKRTAELRAVSPVLTFKTSGDFAARFQRTRSNDGQLHRLFPSPLPSPTATSKGEDKKLNFLRQIIEHCSSCFFIIDRDVWGLWNMRRESSRAILTCVACTPDPRQPQPFEV